MKKILIEFQDDDKTLRVFDIAAVYLKKQKKYFARELLANNLAQVISQNAELKKFIESTDEGLENWQSKITNSQNN